MDEAMTIVFVVEGFAARNSELQLWRARE